ncbi:MAG: glycosyltransferase family protein [Solirubrobacteraceae bacterium]
MKTRVALYSHDAVGLGHVRRNLALAGALAGDGRHSALLIAGAREAGTLPMPPGVECLTLPAFAKSDDGSYTSRTLDLSLAALVRLRAETIRAALDMFEPDALIVDKHPLGFGGELEPAVELLRERGRTRLVLGLRDVLDDPGVVRAEWVRDGVEDAIERFYDRVWVYGDPRVYDTVREYGMAPRVAARTSYTGYLARREPTDPADGVPAGRLALCLVGGGQDGPAVASAFANAPLPPGMTGVVVAGPFMPQDARRRLHALAGRRQRLQVLDFVQEPQRLLRRADRVVAMGGYNTVCELLAADRPALVVPRERPRTEQLLRARRLAALGLVHTLAPGDLSPRAIGDWLAGDADRGPHPAGLVDLDGLRRVPRLMGELLSTGRVGSLVA